MKKIFSILFLCSLICCATFAQQEKAPLWEGNKFYKENDYQKSMQAYNKALSIAPANPLANYNMGNTQFRLNNFDTAAKMYDNTIANATNAPEKQKAFYNKGVSLSKQKKLEESIAAYKEALKLNAKDKDARENLQKALLEKKEQDKKNEKKDDEKKDKDKKEQDKKDENKKQDDQKDKQDKKQEPKEKQSKLTKQQVDQLLKSLEQKEKDLQKKMQKTNESSGQEKDW